MATKKIIAKTLRFSRDDIINNSAFRLISSPFCLLNEKLEVIYANKAFSSLTGVRFRPLQVMKDRNLKPFNDYLRLSDEHTDIMNQSLCTEKEMSTECRASNAEHDTVSITLSISPLKDNEGLWVSIIDQTDEYTVYKKYKRLTRLLDIKEDHAFVGEFSILLIDDDKEVLTLMERAISNEGFDVTVMDDPNKGVEVLSQKVYDLILLDYHLGNMSGLEILDQIKSNHITCNIPVIIISGHTEEEEIQGCLKMGAIDYIEKPIPIAKLREKIYDLLSKKRSMLDRMQLTQTKEILENILPEHAIEDLKKSDTSKPRPYNDVAVMFCDIVDFTHFCSTNDPNLVIDYFEEAVELYEEINRKHQVEKIKTIGDAFLSVSGMLENPDNVVQSCVACAEEFITKAKDLKSGWKIRVGIHYGSLMGGVIGHDRLFFDVWGDVVNASQRIQALSEAWQVSMSQEAWKILDSNDSYLNVGEFQLKGIDHPMTIYQNQI